MVPPFCRNSELPEKSVAFLRSTNTPSAVTAASRIVSTPPRSAAVAVARIPPASISRICVTGSVPVPSIGTYTPCSVTRFQASIRPPSAAARVDQRPSPELVVPHRSTKSPTVDRSIRLPGPTAATSIARHRVSPSSGPRIHAAEPRSIRPPDSAPIDKRES